jgi:prepilin-type processing-associated H-X9-DG protein
LLVVLGLVGVLGGLLLPGLARGRALAQATACLGNLRQVGIALQLYVEENGNRMPMMRDRRIDGAAESPEGAATNALPAPDEVLGRHLGNVRVLRCGADRQGVFEGTGSSYSWNSLLNGQDADRLRVFMIDFAPHQIPVFFDKEGFHRARGERKAVNYLYADGHLRNLLVLEGTR